MNEKEAWRILEEFPDTRGYDLAVQWDEYGGLFLNDGIVWEEITEDTAEELRTRIEAWIDTATQGENNFYGGKCEECGKELADNDANYEYPLILCEACFFKKEGLQGEDEE